MVLCVHLPKIHRIFIQRSTSNTTSENVYEAIWSHLICMTNKLRYLYKYLRSSLFVFIKKKEKKLIFRSHLFIFIFIFVSFFFCFIFVCWYFLWPYKIDDIDVCMKNGSCYNMFAYVLCAIWPFDERCRNMIWNNTNKHERNLMVRRWIETLCWVNSTVRIDFNLDLNTDFLERIPVSTSQHLNIKLYLNLLYILTHFPDLNHWNK